MPPDPSPPRPDSSPVPSIRRGAQAGVPLKVGIIGGGRAAADLLALMAAPGPKPADLEVVGVADLNPEAAGMIAARAAGIFTTDDLIELYDLDGLNLVIELTGSNEVRQRMLATKPANISSIDHRGARLIWDLIQMDSEKREVERKAEEALKAERDWVQKILDTLPDKIMVLNPNRTIHSVNRTMIEKTGLDESELIGRICHKVKKDARLPCLGPGGDCPFTAAFATGQTAHVLHRRRDADGQLRYEEVVGTPILDDHGRVVQVVEQARDVTELVALKEELSRQREYLSNLVAYSSDMIITTDLKGRIVTFNPGGERMLGYGADLVIGTPIGDLWLDPDQRSELMHAVQAQGAVNNFPAALRAADGSRVEISLSLAMMKDAEGRVLGTVGISKDVTEENRLKRQLIESERLAAVGQAVAGLAHGIKNILHGFTGGAYLVETGLKRGDRGLVQKGWGTVTKAIGRIKSLSLDMLLYSRDRQPEIAPCPPLELLKRAAEAVADQAASAGVELVVEAGPGPGAAADPELIDRALVNLLGNAIDACREKDYPPGQSATVRAGVRYEPDQVRLVIADNGPGISPEVERRLFERFVSTKKSRGTGLGLAVTAKIVREHGGRLEVESTPGQGATFSIVLPRAGE